MEVSRFEELVTLAVGTLPEELAARLENVDIVVQDMPTARQRQEVGIGRGEVLLGLYEGVPLTERGQGYTFVLPDKITIFQRPIEARCGQNRDRIAAEIARVVRHEIAHHFGISDTRLEELERRG